MRGAIVHAAAQAIEITDLLFHVALQHYVGTDRVA